MKKSIKKPLLKTLLAVICLGTVAAVMFAGHENSSILNFRTTQSPLKPSRLDTPDLTGLRELNASASGRLSEAKVQKFFKDLPRPLIVIDARAEQDLYWNGISAGWLGIKYLDGKLEDRLYLTTFWQKPFFHIKCAWRRLCNFGSWKSPLPQELESEESFLKKHGIGYYCFEGKRHHVHGDEVIEKFVAYLDHLPANTWLHFHCAAGRGRSTTFIILYDIYRNAKRAPLPDIILRQHLIGGENIFDVALRPKGTWSQEDLLRRKNLVHDFYDYMKDPKGYGITTWRQWKKINGRTAQL